MTLRPRQGGAVSFSSSRLYRGSEIKLNILMRKKLTIILIASILISVGIVALALGYFFAAKNKKTNVEGEKIIAIANWQVYNNQKFGYLIKYPKNWQIIGTNSSQETSIFFASQTAEENILQSSGKLSDGLKISVKENTSSLSSRDWVIENIPSENFQKRNLRDISLNNNPATKIVDIKDASFGIYLAKEKEVIEITGYVNQKKEEIDAIINTFSWIEISTVEQDTIYKVKPGETLSYIASKFNMAWPTLARYNKIKSPDDVIAGQKLKIPSDPTAIPSKGSGFSLDLDLARYYQSQVDSGKEVWRLNPVEVAKRELEGRSGISSEDDFRIISEDRLAGDVMVEIAKKDGSLYLAEIIQPIKRGTGGIWMVKSLKNK